MRLGRSSVEDQVEDMKNSMSRIAAWTGLCLGMLLVGAVNAAAQARPSVSLAGPWRFALDRQGTGIDERWFAKDLSSKIALPGNLEAQGYGDEITGDTPWTTPANESYWKRLTLYAKYRRPGNVKIPFWWQPERYYVGKAWYQRDIEIPAEWQGKRVALTLERVHWESQVWLDDRPLGVQNGLHTPHHYELGANLAPGKHRLTVCVDNRVVVDVGLSSHGLGDQTQGNWNGIVGRIELSATSPIWIEDTQAYPDFQKKQTVIKVQIGNATGLPGSGILRAGAARTAVNWDAKGGTAELVIPFGAKVELWDEFSPRLQQVVVSLDAGANKNERRLNFGLRQIQAGEDLFLINGRKSYLRGTLECAVFPLTGYPPTDVASWKRIISIAQSYGLNYMRFHSWCPPEAAFSAADELGFYLRPEMEWSGTLGAGTPLDSWIYQETDRIFREYGNHPSFMLMAPSNEPFGKDERTFLANWVTYARSRDGRRLYTACVGGPILPENQFSIFGDARGVSGWHGGDYRHVLEKCEGGSLLDKPILQHEMTQWQAFPNLEESSKYTGNRKARYLDIFRESLAEKGLLDQAKAFLIASGKLQVLCIKEDIEATLRTRGDSGFELLGLTDFPGQGVSFCGVLDVFWDSKGYVTPEEYRRFCGTTVPLLRLTCRTFTSDETLEARAEIAHFGKEPLRAAVPEWKLLDASGKVVAGEAWPARTIELGRGIELGTVRLPLKGVPVPGQYRLVVGIQGTPFANDWNVWVYPAAGKASAGGRLGSDAVAAAKPSANDPFASAGQASAGANAALGEAGVIELPSGPVAAPSVGVNLAPAPVLSREVTERSVLVSSTLSPRAVAALNQGGRVLLLPSKRREIPPQFPRGEFQPVFWNNSVWPWGASETLGLLCDGKHPALSQFPTSFHADWQWEELIRSSRWLVLDGLPEALRPIVQGIDYQYASRWLAMVFECRLGAGKLLVCAADLQADLDKRPAARQLRRSLIDYMASEQFQPKVTLTLEQLRPICGRDPLPMPPCKVVADSDGGGEWNAAKAVDGDLTTFWHSAWSKSSAYPHHLTLEFNEPQKFGGIACAPNSRSRSGWIREYVVEISDDGQQWTQVAAGEFTEDATEKRVLFTTPVTTRFLKLTARSAWDHKSPLASLAELTILPPVR